MKRVYTLEEVEEIKVRLRNAFKEHWPVLETLGVVQYHQSYVFNVRDEDGEVKDYTIAAGYGPIPPELQQFDESTKSKLSA